MAQDLEAERLQHQTGKRAPEAQPARVPGPAPIDGDRIGDIGEIERDLAKHQRRGRKQRAELAADQEHREQGRTGQSVDRLQRVDRLDRHHRQSERAKARRADHVAIPVLRLQEAGEPAPPLPEERAEIRRRVGNRRGRGRESRPATAGRCRWRGDAGDGSTRNPRRGIADRSRRPRRRRRAGRPRRRRKPAAGSAASTRRSGRGNS